MHYAVPRILYEDGRLARLFTDICITDRLAGGLALLPTALKRGLVARLKSRRPERIPAALVNCFPLLGLDYRRRLRAALTRDEATKVHLRMGRMFGERVLRHSGSNLPAVFTFNSAGLVLLEACRAAGGLACLEQCSSPRLKERIILREESAQHPEWGDFQEISEADVEYAEVEQKEWAAATCILCPSAFVREGLIAAGAAGEKIHVVPYGVDPVHSDLQAGSARRAGMAGGQLKVLVAGQVCLQKGSQYVYEAAGLLGRSAIFRMVGSTTHLPQRLLTQLQKRIDVVGQVARPYMYEHYRWADIFVLPSLCEGSATVTYEAIAHGLPVICTTNTGSVVRDGVEGFIVPGRDALAIAERVEQLAMDADLRAELSANARARAEQFTVAEYGRRLLAVLGE